MTRKITFLLLVFSLLFIHLNMGCSNNIEYEENFQETESEDNNNAGTSEHNTDHDFDNDNNNSTGTVVSGIWKIIQMSNPDEGTTSFPIEEMVNCDSFGKDDAKMAVNMYLWYNDTQIRSYFSIKIVEILTSSPCTDHLEDLIIYCSDYDVTYEINNDMIITTSGAGTLMEKTFTINGEVLTVTDSENSWIKLIKTSSSETLNPKEDCDLFQ